jgi:predicted ATP-grasp superfamily ATP-dependent carboligase
MPTPVVVLNMHYSGLGIARSLAPAGIPVFGLSAYDDFPGSSSKYCSFFKSPDSLLAPLELKEFLLEFAARFDCKPILLPTRDHDIEFLLSNRADLETRFVIPLASRAIIEGAMNKDRCFAAARECGIALPQSFTINSGDELRQLENSIPFPAIIKPLYAKQWRRPGIWQTVQQQKAVHVENFEELQAFYALIEPLDPLATVQEYVPGPESSLVIFGSYCRPGGNVRAFFTARKLLQVPPLRGTGVIVEGLPLPGIVEPSRRLLKALDFAGISEIEFKVHDTTKVPYLIEVNPRHWDQHELGTACGVNLSMELYRDFAGPDPAPATRDDGSGPLQQEATVRWIAEQDLLLYALSAVKNGEATVSEILRLARKPRRFAVSDTTDLRPTFKQAGNVARQILGLARIKPGIARSR